MSNKDFHNKPFDKSTQLKLDIIRLYIREWLPVMLTRSSTGKNFKEVRIFDFFSGPGTDSEGNYGTPLIILDEIVGYLKVHSQIVNSEVKCKLFFNDKSKEKIEELKKNVSKYFSEIPNFVNITYYNKEFANCLELNRTDIFSQNTSCLLLIDQFGIKEVSEERFCDIIQAPKTDILFYSASQIVKRFPKEPEIQQYLNISLEEIQETDQNYIHKIVCNHFRKLIPPHIKYYLAPFSIKKNSNIYGLIFGSHSLYGLEKFLHVAWKIDELNGEANMDINRDHLDQPTLFDSNEEYATPRKFQLFKNDLLEYLKSEPNNLQLYEFSLTNGFKGSHCKDILTQWNNKGIIEVISLISPSPKKNSFYLTWDNYSKDKPKIKVKIKGDNNG